ncbi:MAG: GPW/gp25 family protein [Oscillospiraceae bacterium]|nr:GPW/gp25 family protein [Oscillospiraceae bacterium]
MGRGVKFPLQIDPKTGKIAMVSEEEDIAEAIGIIIGTVQGERVMRPDFGSNVLDYTFSANSDSQRQSLAFDLSEQLGYLEPRISDIEVRCRKTNVLDGAVVVEVSYRVRSTNNRYNRVYPFYRTEGSEGGDEI